jgi:hypothetical protein
MGEATAEATTRPGEGLGPSGHYQVGSSSPETEPQCLEALKRTCKLGPPSQASRTAGVMGFCTQDLGPQGWGPLGSLPSGKVA